MRVVTLALAVGTGLSCLNPPPAHAQIPQGLLQQLLPGNGAQSQQGAEQAVREAYERGYRQGRQDQERADIERGRSSQSGSYPGGNNTGYQNYQNNQQRNPYGR